jgi:hypothetical protein
LLGSIDVTGVQTCALPISAEKIELQRSNLYVKLDKYGLK